MVASNLAYSEDSFTQEVMAAKGIITGKSEQELEPDGKELPERRW